MKYLTDKNFKKQLSSNPKITQEILDVGITHITHVGKELGVGDYLLWALLLHESGNFTMIMLTDSEYELYNPTTVEMGGKKYGDIPDYMPVVNYSDKYPKDKMIGENSTIVKLKRNDE